MKDRDFKRLVKSIKQAGKIKRGKATAGRLIEYSPADIKAIRGKLRKSQAEFALMIGVSVSTLQNWEQGRRQPEGPARALLKIAEEARADPQLLHDAPLEAPVRRLDEVRAAKELILRWRPE